MRSRAFFAAVLFISAAGASYAGDSASCVSPASDDSFDKVGNLNKDRCGMIDAVTNSCAGREEKKMATREEFLKKLESDPSDASGFRAARKAFASIPKGSPGYQKLTGRLVDGMLEHQYKFNCQNGVKVSMSSYVTTFPYYEFDPSKNAGTSAADAWKKFKDSPEGPAKMTDAEEKAKKFQKKFTQDGESVIGSMRYCPVEVTADKGSQYLAVLHPPCGSNLSVMYEDNASDTDLSKLGSDADFKKCIETAKANGAKIDKITVNSSASSLNNTGEAEKKYCKKGFLDLSKARAEDVKSNVLPKLLPPEFAGKVSDATVISNGANGDGTSGPCPYEIVDGKEKLKAEYQTPSGKKQLDGYRYVKVNVSFVQPWKPANQQPTHYAYNTGCSQAGFACR
ncbi:MAG: hypothetical protein HYW49_10545 [Deltaproteobacteria bacterium]|nr:hypothetical protein [Deltaproteobacteria bacterium]